MFSVDPDACEAYDTALKCKLYMTVKVVYHIHHIHIYTLLYCTVLYCTVLYCTELYCTVLYCTVLY